MPAAAIVGSVAGGLISSSGAKSAAKSQAAAAAQADATQRYMYDQTRADQAPFREAGLNALIKQGILLGTSGDPNSEGYGSLLRQFGQSDLDNDVVYQNGLQFGLNQGNQGINRMAAASGNQLSGATLKALTRFSNDYGTTKANDSYNRFVNDQTNTFNRLSGVSGAGQQATNQIAASGQNYANNVSQNQIGLGNARGASAIAQGNALSGAIGQGINSYQQQNYLNSLNNQNSGSGFGWAGMNGFGDSYSTSYGE